MKFFEDWDPDTTYDAVAFNEPWNGWATPVVTRETLAAIGLHWDEAGGESEGLTVLTWDGDVAVFHFRGDYEHPWPMRPDRDGLYHLDELGFCFVRVEG